MSNYICAICRDFLANPVGITPDEYEEDYEQVLTFCGHIFHDGCISEWLETQRDHRTALSCPVCFRKVLLGDLVPIHPLKSTRFVDYPTLQSQVGRHIEYLAILCEETAADKEKFKEMMEKRSEAQKEVKETAEICGQLQDVADSLFCDSETREFQEKEHKRLTIKHTELKNRLSENLQTNINFQNALAAIKMHFKGGDDHDSSTNTTENGKEENAQCPKKLTWKKEDSKEILDKIKQTLAQVKF